MFVKGKPIDFAKVRKVLLIQLGDIGDVVWTEPTIRAFRETFPSLEVFVLARGGFGELLESHPDVRRVFNVAGAKGGLLAEIPVQSALVGALRRERFDVVFDLRAGDRGAVMARLTGAPVRVSHHYSQDIPFWRNSLFTHVVQPPPLETLVHGAAEQTLAIAREFGVDTKDRAPRLRVSERVKTRVSAILQDSGLQAAGRWVSVNPFSRWTYKEWPHERWAPVLEALWERHRLAAGCTLHVCTTTPVIPLAGQGLILGHVFSRAGLPITHAAQLPDCRSPADLRRHILQDCWGAYLIVQADPAQAGDISTTCSPPASRASAAALETATSSVPQRS